VARREFNDTMTEDAVTTAESAPTTGKRVRIRALRAPFVRNGRKFSEKAEVLDVEALNWTEAQWAAARADRNLVVEDVR
jgi:hypothetical protein